MGELRENKNQVIKIVIMMNEIVMAQWPNVFLREKAIMEIVTLSNPKKVSEAVVKRNNRFPIIEKIANKMA